MHIKWIVCKVKNGMKQSFSDAQKMWREIKNSEGFTDKPMAGIRMTIWKVVSFHFGKIKKVSKIS